MRCLIASWSAPSKRESAAPVSCECTLGISERHNIILTIFIAFFTVIYHLIPHDNLFCVSLLEGFGK